MIRFVAEDAANQRNSVGVHPQKAEAHAAGIHRTQRIKWRIPHHLTFTPQDGLTAGNRQLETDNRSNCWRVHRRDEDAAFRNVDGVLGLNERVDIGILQAESDGDHVGLRRLAGRVHERQYLFPSPRLSIVQATLRRPGLVTKTATSHKHGR